MKTSMSILLFLLLPLLYVNAQEGAYAKAMQSALAQMQQAATAEEQQATINTFSRIGEAMPGEWLPGYYKNLTRLNGMYGLPDAAAKDKMLTEVLSEVDQLLKAYPGNSELLTLKGYQHLLFIAADPASRGPQFSAATIHILQQAIAANPENPRPYLLLGQMQWGMARFMNSSTDEACRLFKRANQLYAATPEAEGLMPAWGAEDASKLAQQCEVK